MIRFSANGIGPRRALRLATRRAAGAVAVRRAPLHWCRRRRMPAPTALQRPLFALHWALHLRVDAATRAGVPAPAIAMRAASDAAPPMRPSVQSVSAAVERHFVARTSLQWRATATAAARAAGRRGSARQPSRAIPAPAAAQSPAARSDVREPRSLRVDSLRLIHRARRPSASLPRPAEREPAVAAVTALQQRIELVWRKSAPTTAAAEGAAAPAVAAAAMQGAAGQRNPPSALAPAPTAPARNVAAALDPALADRLADDVIRRLERHVRIQRERRGL